METNIERIPVQDLQGYLHTEIISMFMVMEKELREGTKDPYIRIKLGDCSGYVNANIWSNAHHFNNMFEVGDVIKIKALVKEFKGQLQLTINKIRVAEDSEYDLSDFLATTDKDIGKLGDSLFQCIESIENEFLKLLLKSIFEDVEFFPLFAKSPAAKNWHHNFIGGLLEHTMTVVDICDFASKLYPVDRDLLVTGALLHDLGKVYEYDTKSVPDFTNVGRLVGHISIADHLICKKAEMIDAFPQDLLMKVRHLILSHHGELEKGAVRLPQIIEAIVLHYADNLDAQTVGVKQLIEGVKNDQSEWTEYDRLNDRYFYLK